MENEERRTLQMFSEAAKEIMRLTDEVHEELDNLLSEVLKKDCNNLEELIGNLSKTVRAKLCCINNINMEKLYGVPRTFLEEGE